VIFGIYLRTKSVAAALAHSNPPPALPHSVAVLPFANLSGDANQDYFSDGLSEEVLDSLSSIPDLHVAARISSFTFKNRGALIAAIGLEWIL
jgi:adenylate cyclase